LAKCGTRAARWALQRRLPDRRWRIRCTRRRKTNWGRGRSLARHLVRRARADGCQQRRL